MNQDELDKLVSSASDAIGKKFGQDSITTLDSPENWSNITNWLPTGSLALDYAIGRPGIPIGRATEIIGLESTGKSLLGMYLLKKTQGLGGIAVLVDTETRYDKNWAARIGLNIKQIIVLQPLTLEDIFKQVIEYINFIRGKNKNILITFVVDSIAATPTEEELAKDLTEYHMGLHARKISQTIRIIARLIAKQNICFIMINQQKERLGVVFGEKHTTLGGHAIRYWSSVRIEIRKIGTIINKYKQVIGIQTRIKIVKSSIAPPFREAEINILFDTGIDVAHSVLPVGIISGEIIEKGSGWFEINNKKYQIKDEEFTKILTDKKFIEKIRKKVGIAERKK